MPPENEDEGKIPRVAAWVGLVVVATVTTARANSRFIFGTRKLNKTWKETTYQKGQGSVVNDKLIAKEIIFLLQKLAFYTVINFKTATKN